MNRVAPLCGKVVSVHDARGPRRELDYCLGQPTRTGGSRRAMMGELDPDPDISQT